MPRIFDRRVDVSLNTWAAVLAAAHAPAYDGASSPLTAELASSWSSLAATSLPTWRSAAARQLVADAVRSRAEGYPYEDWTMISWVRSVHASCSIPHVTCRCLPRPPVPFPPLLA